MNIKNQLAEIKTINKCQKFLNKELFNYKTLYSKVYSDYEGKTFSKQIKAYEKDGTYLVVVTNLDNNEIKEIEICVSNKKPKQPHPVFPIVASFAPGSTIYNYSK